MDLHALPYSGGLCEQPGPAMQRIEKVLDARAAIDKAEAEIARKQAESE